VSKYPTTRYFNEQVLRKRPYLTLEICAEAVAAPLRSTVQDDGRIRYWGKVTLPNEFEPRILRVITLEDGVTIHNAFPDRNFSEEAL
jgi:hypothetical protein